MPSTTLESLREQVLTPSPNVSAIEFDASMLLVDDHTLLAVPLNSAGGLVWNCFDGESTVGEICLDLAEGFGVSERTVFADVAALVESLLRFGALTMDGWTQTDDSVAVSGCCGGGQFTVPDEYEARVHHLVHTGVWLEESADSCQDKRFRRSPDLEAVARISTPRGTDRLVGLRANDPEVAAGIRSRLGRSLADDEPFGFPNISVHIAPPDGRITRKHVVARRGLGMFHTFSRDEAIDAALALVPGFVAPPDDQFALRARVLVRDGGAVLVDEAFAAPLDALRRRLEAQGWGFRYDNPVLVDAGSETALLAGGGPGVAPRAERVPITAVVATGMPSATPELDAFDAARTIRLLADGEPENRASDLRQLIGMLQRTPLLWAPAVDRRDLLPALSRVEPRSPLAG